MEGMVRARDTARVPGAHNCSWEEPNLLSGAKNYPRKQRGTTLSLLQLNGLKIDITNPSRKEETSKGTFV